MYVFRGKFGIANITVAISSLAITMLTFNLTVKDIRSSLLFVVILCLVSVLVLYEMAVVVYVLSISVVIDRRGISYRSMFKDVTVPWDNIEKIEEKKIKFKILHKKYLKNYYEINIFYRHPEKDLDYNKTKKISISQEVFDEYEKISKVIKNKIPYEQCKRSGIFG